MASPKRNKARGYELEAELVKLAKEHNLPAQRAFCSNGRSLGKAETVDLVVDGVTVQAKRRKRLAKFLLPPPGADYVVVRQDRSPALILIPFEEWLQLRGGEAANE